MRERGCQNIPGADDVPTLFDKAPQRAAMIALWKELDVLHRIGPVPPTPLERKIQLKLDKLTGAKGKGKGKSKGKGKGKEKA